MLLCREHLVANREQTKLTTASLSDALCDIKLACDIARDLAKMDFYAQAYSNDPRKDTGDTMTSVRHLVDTAEAYRLAALLTLCQTFQDLEVKAVAQDILSSAGVSVIELSDDAVHKHISLLLALQLVETLRRIPADSGTRCIQPALFVCAGSGLKYDVLDGAAPVSLAGVESPSFSHNASPFTDRFRRDTGGCTLYDPSPQTDMGSSPIAKCTMEVQKGRRFVVDRLCALQRSLPPKPIGIATELVTAIWKEYDSVSSNESKHWIEVMTGKGLQTLFG